MRLQKIYEDFLAHTQLEDSIYKTVFIQFDEVLNMISNLKWIHLKYTVGTQTEEVEFSENKPVPLYIIEIIHNTFYQFFSFPDGCVVELIVEFEGIEYKIYSNNNQTTIPEQLMFIKNLDIFKYFLVTKPVYDIFNEFENLFSFSEQFRTKIESIYGPLKDRFAERETKKEIDIGTISKSSIADSQSLVEVLKKRRKELLNTIAVLVSEIEAVSTDQKKISGVLRVISGLDHDKKIYVAEYNGLKLKLEEETTNFNSVLDIISKIQVELDGLYSSVPEIQATPEFKKEIKYLLDKKEVFKKQQDNLMRSTKGIKDLMDSTNIVLNGITDQLRKANAYNVDDINVLEDRLNELNKKKENAQIELLTVENEIKQHVSKTNMDSVKMEKIPIRQATSGEALNEVSRREIVSHLNNSLQPNSITTVLNYLRYYFAFHVTRIASELESRTEGIESAMLQAIASRLVLVRCFNMYFNNMFSLIDFADNRIRYVSLIKVGI